MAVACPSVEKICSRVQYVQLFELLTSEQAFDFDIEALQCRSTTEPTPPI